ncbi:MAG: hypothetical protein V4683_15465 [Bacteroidota bacterium]
MVKRILFLTFFALLYSCNQKGNQDFPGAEFIGNWHTEAIKNPKYPHFIYDYSIIKSGDGFTVKIHVTCPKCKDAISEERNYTFAGNFNEDQNVFEIQKEGYKEILIIPELQDYMVSSRFPKYIFTKLK